MRLLACLIVAPQRGYDEPAILSYAISSFCPTSADGLQSPFAPIAGCGPPKSPILPELCRTHLGLLDARAEFGSGILVLLQCGALRRPALPGMQFGEHDPKRLQGPRCEMPHKRQSHFAFVIRRWLTWFYPQVCSNQALSGASTFLCPPCRQPPPQIADVTYLGC